MVHLAHYKKVLLVLSNVPLLFLIKKHFWLGVTTFTVSTMYHYKQVTTTDVEEIDKMCFWDVLMSLSIGLYLLKTNGNNIPLCILPLAAMLCMPYYFGMREYYAELHSSWHILVVVILFWLFN